MGVSHIAVIAAISLSGLLPASCTKTFSAKAANKHAPSPSQMVTNSTPVVVEPGNSRDLGKLELTDRHETLVNLGAGRSCTITPKLLDRNNLQLTMALQTTSGNGRTAGLIVTRVTTRPGQSFEMAVGDMDITFTPEIAPE